MKIILWNHWTVRLAELLSDPEHNPFQYLGILKRKNDLEREIQAEGTPNTWRLMFSRTLLTENPELWRPILFK